MKKRLLIVVLLVVCVFQVACAKEESHSQGENQITTESQTDEIVTTKDDSEGNDDVAMKPHIMVDGRLYADTGYVSSMGRCGVMDGVIDTMTDVSKFPEKDNQSNFGTGYEYIHGSEGIILVVIDGQDVIFRDVASSSMEMPIEVANFNAKISEINEESMVVSYFSQPGGFKISEGNYVVSMDNLLSEVAIGDVVTIWFSGVVMETDPAQIGAVYRIEKYGGRNLSFPIKSGMSIILEKSRSIIT